jgi:WD40 repeat protein
MKKMMFAAFFFFCLTAVQLHGQNIAFTYDQAGNRIERKTIPLKSSSVSDNEPEQLFEDSLADQEIRIYPNPSEGHLMVSISHPENIPEGKITISDVNGRLLATKIIEGQNTSLNLSDQPSGLYLMTITLGEESSVWKIVKK